MKRQPPLSLQLQLTPLRQQKKMKARAAASESATENPILERRAAFVNQK